MLQLKILIYFIDILLFSFHKLNYPFVTFINNQIIITE